jgi:hypothetical protein
MFNRYMSKQLLELIEATLSAYQQLGETGTTWWATESYNRKELLLEKIKKEIEGD